MAEAKKVPTDYSLQLTLTRREAEILKRLLGRVCQGKNATDPIYDALTDAKVSTETKYQFIIKSGNTSGIEFKDLSNISGDD